MKLEKYLEDPEFIKKLKKLSYAILCLIILFDIGVHLLAGHTAGHFFGDSIWGFWSIFGFIVCILLIKGCKGIGHIFLMKKEDYYD